MDFVVAHSIITHVLAFLQPAVSFTLVSISLASLDQIYAAKLMYNKNIFCYNYFADILHTSRDD